MFPEFQKHASRSYLTIKNVLACIRCKRNRCTGAVLGAVGIYEPFTKFAGAGATVPLLGFGNTLWKGMKTAIDENGFLGLFTGGFTACAAGVSAALIFGYLASLIFHSKMRK